MSNQNITRTPVFLPGLLIGTLLGLFPTLSHALTQTLTLTVGEQRLTKFTALKQYTLSGEAIRILPSKGSEILIKAIKPGLSQIKILPKEGPLPEPWVDSLQVRVLPLAEISPETQACALALSTLNEVNVLSCPKGYCLTGEITSSQEASKVHQLETGPCSTKVENQTHFTAALLQERTSKIQNWIRTEGLADKLRTEIYANQIWVRGPIRSLQIKNQVVSTLKKIFAPVILELDSLPDDHPTVHFNVFLLELKKNRFSSLGLGWPGAQEGAFKVTPSKIQNLLELDLTLNALEGEGSARILSNPELVVRAPGEAELFSGGEFPIPMRSHGNFNTNFKPFGLLLKLNVQKATPERARLDIATEVSNIDNTLATEGRVPGLQTSRMKTQVDAAFGRPLLLSGLLKQNTRDTIRGLPFFSQIPILGKLFGSEDYLEERSELVAILLPNWTPPPAPLERIAYLLPKGPAPLPRNWVSPEEERRLRESPEFPWNALE